MLNGLKSQDGKLHCGNASHRVVIGESIDMSPSYLLLAVVVGCVASPKSWLEKCIKQNHPSKYKGQKGSPSP